MQKTCMSVWLTLKTKKQLDEFARQEKMGLSGMAARMIEEALDVVYTDELHLEKGMLKHILSILHMTFLLVLDGYDAEGKWKHSDAERKELIALYQHRAAVMGQALFAEDEP